MSYHPGPELLITKLCITAAICNFHWYGSHVLLGHGVRQALPCSGCSLCLLGQCCQAFRCQAGLLLLQLPQDGLLLG